MCTPNTKKIKLHTTRWSAFIETRLAGFTLLLFVFTTPSSFFFSWLLRRRSLDSSDENLAHSLELRPRLVRSQSEHLLHHRLQATVNRLRSIAASSSVLLPAISEVLLPFLHRPFAPHFERCPLILRISSCAAALSFCIFSLVLDALYFL